MCEHDDLEKKESLEKLIDLGYSNKHGLMSFLIDKHSVENMLKMLKLPTALAYGPGVTLRVKEIYGPETQLEYIILVVADYFSKRSPNDKQI